MLMRKWLSIVSSMCPWVNEYSIRSGATGKWARAQHNIYLYSYSEKICWTCYYCLKLATLPETLRKLATLARHGTHIRHATRACHATHSRHATLRRRHARHGTLARRAQVLPPRRARQARASREYATRADACPREAAPATFARAPARANQRPHDNLYAFLLHHAAGPR